MRSEWGKFFHLSDFWPVTHQTQLDWESDQDRLALVASERKLAKKVHSICPVLVWDESVFLWVWICDFVSLSEFQTQTNGSVPALHTLAAISLTDETGFTCICVCVCVSV